MFRSSSEIHVPGGSNTVLLRSNAVAAIFFAVRFCAATNRGWLLFKCSVYFFGKPVDINNGWERYIVHGRSKWLGWSGFGPTTFSQTKLAHAHFEYT